MGAIHLGHHASPRHNVSINALLCLLLMSNDGLEQAVKMLICRVILLLERLKAFGKICA
jgi:hypothetical protein